MDRFAYRDGQLVVEDVPLDAIARAVGTPAYVYSLGTVRDHVDRLQAAFADLDPLVCYAMKANGNLALLADLAARGLGFDIVSGGELDRLRRLGVPGERIVFSGVGKTRAEMDAALAYGVRLFNVESEEELEALARVAAETGRRADVALRVNPDVDPQTHAYIATGLKESKFGLPIARGAELARRVLDRPSLRLVGLQCHIGSQITDVTPYGEAVGRVAELARTLQPDAPDLASLDMGGGFGIFYKDLRAPSFEEYARVVRPHVKHLGLKLLMEPGRVLVGNAGALVTRVLYRKQAGSKRFVIVDAGMNDLIRPSLYGGWHRIWPVAGHGAPPVGEAEGLPRVDVVGPVCESGDFLAKDRPLPDVAAGDLLAVFGVGAYGFTMSSTYNARPRPPEVLVAGDRFAVARRRETYDDLVAAETATPTFVHVAASAVDAEEARP
ncbi:MAG: diaminopimelate decarboxylase [Planctomycetota bacterium]